MTEQEHDSDTPETVEDLEAPAATQSDVAGGMEPRKIPQYCNPGVGSCDVTESNCTDDTAAYYES